MNADSVEPLLEPDAWTLSVSLLADQRRDPAGRDQSYAAKAPIATDAKASEASDIAPRLSGSEFLAKNFDPIGRGVALPYYQRHETDKEVTLPLIRRLCLLVAVLSAFRSPDVSGDPFNLDSLTADGNVVDLRAAEGGLVRLTFLAEDLVRVQAAADGEPTDEGSGKAPIVLDDAWDGVRIRLRDHGTHRTIATPALEVHVHYEPLRLELRRRSDGRTLWRELKPLALSEDGTTQTLSSDADERFFGGGQQNGAFEFKGRLMEISYSGGWEEGDRPSPAPFFMSDRGYGVLRNTWADGVYDFRSDGYLTTTHSENRFDAYVMVGETIHEVLDLYTRLTGRAGLLPRWAFGYGDADCYNDGDNVEKPGTVPDGWSDGATGTTPDVMTVAEKYREHDMPGSWILPNDGYGCGYAELPEVVERLDALGFRTGLWTEDGVEKIAWEVGTAGTRVQKLDVAWTGKGYQWAMDANHDAAQGILANSESRPFIWTVMGWAGIQRHAVTWTGDQSGGWDFIRWHVPTLIGSGLSGMNYSTGDVDGIFGGSPETYTRDLQWKSFTPVLMGMSGWSRLERKHPWWFDEPHRSIHRRYLKLRQRLMPYLYNLARETETTGAPMVRAISWDHPGDPHAYDYPYQFFLGRDLLIAPVYRSQAASGGWREGVYLPEGRWIDYWEGTVLDAGPGGRVVDVPVDLATLPVLVRAGAILPMYPESLYDGEKPPDPLTLDVYPLGESELLLFEDDGNTRRYHEGHYSLQRFKVAEGDRKITLTLEPARGEYEGMLEDRGFVLQVHTPAVPASVTVDGERLPSEKSDTQSGARRGWFHHAGDRGGVLRIHTGRLDVRARHRISLAFTEAIAPAAGSYPAKPTGDGTVPADALMVVSRPAEEPGHPLENAFDGDPDTWFRTIRDQSVAYGPHELTLALGKRRLIEGFRIRPRNDRHWKYGQVRHYEVYLSDVNGRWGEPVATGTLEQAETEQEVRFAPRAGRLLRLRVLATHDDGADPMVLGAVDSGGRPYDALAPVRVGPTTISEFRLLESSPTPRPAVREPLDNTGTDLRLNGLAFDRGLRVRGEGRFDFELDGDWHTLRAEVGVEQGAGARFQVWGDASLLWDSGDVKESSVAKPRVDVRGVTVLSLRTVSSTPETVGGWADVEVVGYEGDTVRILELRPIPDDQLSTSGSPLMVPELSLQVPRPRVPATTTFSSASKSRSMTGAPGRPLPSWCQTEKSSLCLATSTPALKLDTARASPLGWVT